MGEPESLPTEVINLTLKAPQDTGVQDLALHTEEAMVDHPHDAEPECQADKKHIRAYFLNHLLKPRVSRVIVDGFQRGSPSTDSSGELKALEVKSNQAQRFSGSWVYGPEYGLSSGPALHAFGSRGLGVSTFRGTRDGHK
ncbi:hypothetical protein CRG98_027842 [Punica granatum]|uniref:Uncharacterized protein n=1 Tax=Punica granatum TaxID=22663 RepID=A0A2I0J6D8_PUNGR|nr:hypothetical protein CRG98_027842 [Punica granatum]